MNEDGIINRDYIGYIEDLNGTFTYNEVDINQPENFLTKLENMVSDSSKTVLDMQALFEKHYPCDKFGDKHYSYLYPYSYDSAYHNDIYYPAFISKNFYEERLKDREIRLRKELLEAEDVQNELNLLKQDDKLAYDRELRGIERDIKAGVSDYAKQLKKQFHFKRFVYARTYQLALKKLLKDDKVKMVSTDQIGFKKTQFDLMPDMKIVINSNFGYGVSSYFCCNVIYKDITILPYSAVVNYYYVKWHDFINFTEKYKDSRYEWENVFDFVIKITNMARQSPEDFVDKWITREVKMMMKDLRHIMEDPESYLRKCIGNQNNDMTGRYTLVRNFMDSDMKRYKILPEETAIALQADKITGCLYLLDNLRSISSLNKYISRCVKEIVEMNITLLPSLEKSMVQVNDDILKNRKKLKRLLEDIEDKEFDIEPYDIAIDKLLKKMKKKAEDDGHKVRKEDAEKEYASKYPEKYALYCKLCDKLNSLYDKKDSLRTIISYRKEFVTQLEKCKKRITKHIKI